MSPALFGPPSTDHQISNNYDRIHEYDTQYEKGVKHLHEIGVKNVPRKYILPVSERPNSAMIVGKPCTATNTELKLPVIDFAELQGPNRDQVILSLTNALENYGFFQLVNHSIEKEVIEKMIGVEKRFFEQPLAEREKYMSAQIGNPVRYGTSFNQTKDGVLSWRDFLKLECRLPLAHVLPLWPASPFDFRETTATYAKETKLVFEKLADAIFDSLGLTKTIGMNTKVGDDDDDDDDDDDRLKKEIRDGSQLMVLNCYPPCPEPELTLGMPPHSDYGFLTLVLQEDGVEGLQIQHLGHWFTVSPIPGSFVVNVGDHLEIFSNGRYKSVLHRVIVNSTKARFSVASLHSVPFKVKVRAAHQLINDNNPRLYKDTDFAAFIDYLQSCDSKAKNFLQSRKLLC